VRFQFSWQKHQTSGVRHHRTLQGRRHRQTRNTRASEHLSQICAISFGAEAAWQSAERVIVRRTAGYRPPDDDQRMLAEPHGRTEGSNDERVLHLDVAAPVNWRHLIMATAGDITGQYCLPRYPWYTACSQWPYSAEGDADRREGMRDQICASAGPV